MERRTDIARMKERKALEFANNLKLDPKKEERQKVRLCKVCYYTTKIAGSAITESECSLCGKTIVNSSTDCHRVCNECSIENELCVRCGADLNYALLV